MKPAMLKIRLSRTGKKRQPSFRVVVQEHTAPIKGKFVEAIGHYLPATENKEFKINTERVKYWLSVGAAPSDSVAALLKKDGLEGMDKFLAPRDKQRKKKKAQAEAAPGTPSETEVAKTAPEPKEEAPKEEAKGEEPAPEEAKVEEPKAEEAPKEEAKAETEN
jgi:small subunit ribosomal protein S16